MSDFVNTVDVIGDEALTNSIIDRSITEIKDNVSKDIGQYAFCGCSAMKTARFPAVTNVGSYAFNYCAALTTAAFPAATKIGAYAFEGCAALAVANAPLANTVGERAFYGCDALTTANFPVASSVGEYTFRGCTNLMTAYFQQATSIGLGAFFGCPKLYKVNFQSVASIGANAFYGCIALTTADFPAATSIANGAFNGCSRLSKLILRSETMCTLANTGAFSSTPFASGKGDIFVPRALLDSYKAATNWSTYANQFRAIEDYPEVYAPKNSWEGVAARMAAGTYATDYSVGDTIPLNLGAEGVVEMQIAALDTDDLANGSGKAKITWVSKGLLATARRMNPARSGSSGAYTDGTGGVGGWEKSELRSALKNTVKPLIPENVRNMIAEVSKTQKSYDSAGTYSKQATVEDVWIPSTDELSYGIYMGLFPDDENRKKYRQDGSLSNWWTRDAASSSTFYYVDGGNPNTSTATANTYGVALSFCTN